MYDTVAPTNSSFYSFGNSVISSENNIDFGYHKIITKNQLKEFSKNYGTKSLQINTGKITLKKEQNYKKKLDSVMAYT